MSKSIEIEKDGKKKLTKEQIKKLRELKRLNLDSKELKNQSHDK